MSAKRVPGEEKWPHFRSMAPRNFRLPMTNPDAWEGVTPSRAVGARSCNIATECWSLKDATKAAAEGKEYRINRPKHTGVGWAPNRGFSRTTKWTPSEYPLDETLDNRHFYSRQEALPPAYVTARPGPPPNLTPPAEPLANHKLERLAMIQRRAGLHTLT